MNLSFKKLNTKPSQNIVDGCIYFIENDGIYLGKSGNLIPFPDLSKYQTKQDNSLTTKDKTIVGAINELELEKIEESDLISISEQEISDLFDNEGEIPPEGFHIDTELKLNSSNPVTNNAITKEFNNINEGKNNSLVKIEQTLTTAEQQQVQKNIAKGGYMRPLFEAAGAKYNEDTGYYELNGLTDITEEQMNRIYTFTAGSFYAQYPFLGWRHGLDTSIRTNIQPLNSGNMNFNLCQQIEVVNLIPIGRFYQNENITEIKVSIFKPGDFYNALLLRKIIGVINVGDILDITKNYGASYAYDIPKLERILIKKIKGNVTMLKKAPVVDYISWKFMIDNAANTEAITITVHPTTFSYLDGSVPPTPQVGGTTEEWQSLMTDAADKQISFATE